MIVTELVRRHLLSQPSRSSAETERWVQRAHIRCIQLIRFFYVASLLFVVQQLGAWPGLRRTTSIHPQWPAGWLTRIDLSTGITLILAFYGVATALAVLRPEWRTARLAYSFALLQYLAMFYGFGKISHSMHAWLWVSAILVLLPTGTESWDDEASPDQRRSVIGVVVLAQFCLLFFYTLTGLWKIYHGFSGLLGGGPSGFRIGGFSYLLANTLLAKGNDTLFGDFLVRHPPFAWALYNGTVYLETMSVLLVFRPRLHRSWGAALIAFHVGTQAAMGILFPPNILLIGLLLINSPVQPQSSDWRDMVLDLPGIRAVWMTARRLRPTFNGGAQPPVR